MVAHLLDLRRLLRSSASSHPPEGETPWPAETDTHENKDMEKIRRRRKDLVTRTSQGILVVIFFILAAGFILQVRISVEKFLARRTMMTVSKVEAEELEFPRLTVCPGFKPGAFSGHEHKESFPKYNTQGRGMETYFDVFKVDNASESEIKLWWDDITLDLDSFLKYIIVSNFHVATDGQEALPVKTELSPMPPTPSGFLLLERSDGVRNSDLHEEATSADATAAAAPLKFWEFSTPYGRCYDLVTSGLSFRSGEFISILFNTSSLGDRKLEVYLYEHGEIGLMGNHWVTEVFSVSVSQGETLDIPLIKEEVIHLSNEHSPCQEDFGAIEDQDEGYYHCVIEWAKDQYRNMNCSNVCSIPQSYLYTSMMDPPVPPCLTKRDSDCVIRELTKIYSSQDRVRTTGCSIACIRHSFRVPVRHVVSSWDGVSNDHDSLSIINIFYPTTRVLRSEETLILDANAIISAIGGSLSIFLGFSCWGRSKAIVFCFERIMNRRQGSSSFSSSSISPSQSQGRLFSEKKPTLFRNGFSAFVLGEDRVEGEGGDHDKGKRMSDVLSRVGTSIGERNKVAKTPTREASYVDIMIA